MLALLQSHYYLTIRRIVVCSSSGVSLIDSKGNFPQIHERLVYLKYFFTRIKAGYIIHHRLKLQDLRHIKINKKSFFFLKGWELFHSFNFLGGNLSGWELLGWEPFWVGTFLGGNFSGVHYSSLFKIEDNRNYYMSYYS